MTDLIKTEPTGVLPFEQQRREGNRAFEAFKVYLEMGPGRSLAAVGEKLGKSETLIERWSAKFDWLARVQAHGAHLAELERKAIEGKAVEKAVEWEKTHESVRREAWQEAEETIAMVRQARKEWMEKGRLPGWEGMARMLELAFKLKQFAAGLPSDFTKVDAHLTASLDVDWEIALRKAYGQVAPAGDQATVSAPALATPNKETAKAEVIDVETVEPKAIGGEAATEVKP